MKTRSLMGYTGGSLAAAAMATVIGLSAPAYGATFAFALPAGSVNNGGQTVAASGSFNTDGTNVVLTLRNDLAPSAINDVAQLISDISFTSLGGNAGTGNANVTPTTNYLNVSAANDSPARFATAASTPANPAWTLENTAGTRNFHLTVVGCTGSCVVPEGLIISGGPGTTYANANGSIAGNDAHNPFAYGTSSFTLGLLSAGITGFTNILVSFGTAAGNNVAVPIPAAVWLFASGLLGLIGIARRKYNGAVTGSPMAA